jgi:hypothetical protein
MPESVCRAPPVSLNSISLTIFGAEAFRRATPGVCQQSILRVRAIRENPTLPFLPNQILARSVGQHTARRRDVDHIVTTILLPRRVIGCSDIERRDPRRATGSGEGTHSVRRNVGQNECNFVARHRSQSRRRIVVNTERCVRNLELLVHEATGCVVVTYAEPGAGQSVIG